MTMILKRTLIAVGLTVLALSIPTPALAAEAGGGAAAAARAQPSSICDLMPVLWWCKK